MSEYVYTLSDHGEYGATNMVATLERTKIPEIIAINWADQDEAWIEEAVRGARALLMKSDEELAKSYGGWNCQIGWGGVQLHVVKLAK